MRNKVILSCFAAVGLLAFGPANATWIDCSSDVANAVSNTDACEVSDVYTNDPASDPIEVNEDGGAHGYTDWELILQGADGEGSTGASGSWAIPAAAQAMYEMFLVVFKDGDGTFLTAYLTTAFSGDWTNALFGGKDVSHISYYGRGEPPKDVPEPGTLALLGLGLAGLGFGARRRKKA